VARWLEDSGLVFNKLILKKDADTLTFSSERELEDPRRVAVAVITLRLLEVGWEAIVLAVISAIEHENQLITNSYKGPSRSSWVSAARSLTRNSSASVGQSSFWLSVGGES
jgi:hypothetical protein